MDDKATLTKRLDRLAEVLTGTTNFSCYAHTVYEASAEIGRQAAQIAMLREALDAFVSPQLSMQTPTRKLALAALAATSTQADVAAWEKSKRDAALEEVIETLSNCQFITDDPRRDQRDYAMFLSTKKLCVEGVKRLKDKP